MGHRNGCRLSAEELGCRGRLTTFRRLPCVKGLSSPTRMTVGERRAMALSALHSSGLGSGDSRERRSAGYGGFDGFSEFVRARQQDLVRAAYLVCGDLAEAEDIVQGALVKLAGRWSSVGRAS